MSAFRALRRTWVALLAVCSVGLVQAADSTVGLFLNTLESSPGYTLFAPMGYTTTYLIDNDGQKVHSWQSTLLPRMSVYLREDGLLLRTAPGGQQFGFNSGGGVGGRVQLIDWDGQVVWDLEYADTSYRQHHDVASLPNGNILIIAWERKSKEEALAAGRDPALLSSEELWSERVVEVRPIGVDSGEVVWEWHVWDHLIQDFDSLQDNFGEVENHPELIHLNFPAAGPDPGREDWLHINSVAYNDRQDQVIVTVNRFREIWIIDHSTTSAEAATHSGGAGGRGGDLLYRWGNPRAYRRGGASDVRLFRAHDGHWIPDSLPGGGDILIFNNGNNRPDGSYASIDEISPPVDSAGRYFVEPDSTFGPDSPIWRYTAPTPADFVAPNLSGAQRMPNGNTLICNGPIGHFFEVDSTGQTVWHYVNPVTHLGPIVQGDVVPTTPEGQANSVFKIARYPADYPGLAGRNLAPQGPIELYLTGVADQQPGLPDEFRLSGNFPNPFNPATTIRFSLSIPQHVRLDIYSLSGKRVIRLLDGSLRAGAHAVDWRGTNSRGKHVSSGVYFARLTAGGRSQIRKMLLLK